MYYIIGDIHGMLGKLLKLYDQIKGMITENDTLIFLGDYIDRGPSSYEVVEFLITLSKTQKTVFLKGNHEDMLLNYLAGKDHTDIYLYNGGDATLRSYERNTRYAGIPEKHMKFFKSLHLYFETDDFIAVHAGINPAYERVAEQPEEDTLWIRDAFFRSPKRWPKLIVFGHTPTVYISHEFGSVFIDHERNIIGIDTGAVYGGYLSCLRIPDRLIIQC